MAERKKSHHEHEKHLEKKHHTHNAENHGLKRAGHHAEQEHSGKDHHGHSRLRHRYPEEGHMAEARTEYHTHHAHGGSIERKTGGRNNGSFTGYSGDKYASEASRSERRPASQEEHSGKRNPFAGIGSGGEGSE